VNPASLGVSHEKKRRSDGESSPVTPWDSHLEALVSEKEKRQPLETSSPSFGEKSSVGGETSVEGTPTSHVKYAAADSFAAVHPVCGPSTAYGRTALHQAVCEADVDKVQDELSEIVVSQKEVLLDQRDEAGYSPLHSACALLSRYECATSEEYSNEVVRLLLSARADPSREDSKGNTPLHWAARSGDREASVQLLMKNCPLDAKNQSGETPLHWAMRAGSRGAEVVAVLLENGARPGILNKSFHRALDVAADGFVDEEGSVAWHRNRDSQQGKKMSKEHKRALKQKAGERRDSRANFLFRSAHSRTLVLHHPECLEHHAKSQADWEVADRITSIMRRVPSSDATGATEISGIFPHEVTVSQEFDRGNLDLLSRVHSTEYLSFVNKLSKDLEKKIKDSEGNSSEDADTGPESPPPVVPFTPMVQRSMIKIDESNVKHHHHSDTSFSAGSLKAARRAAGAVQHAVDW
jgi:hypothetical protein